MRFPKYLLLVRSLVLVSVAQAAESSLPNVVFIGIDDMRPELGCYGSPIAVTPNMDAQASDGLLFNRAYVQQPICGPSRASLMTGMRPDSSGVPHNLLEFRDLQPDVVTLPQYFREHGYETAFCGKIFHGKQKDQEHSWSRKPAKVNLPRATGFALPENLAIQQKMRDEMFALYGEQAKYGLASGPAYESADVPDETYEDRYQTRIAIATMKEMAKNKEKPFFMALGFKKPHLNWVSSKRYWDLYKPEDIPLATNTQAPTDGSPMGLHPGFELRVRHGIRETYFEPLIEKQEATIQTKHQWDREFFEVNVTGYAMRTERYRLVAWKDKIDLGKAPIEIELYDHETDPLETTNIAKQHPELVARLLSELNAGWKDSLPQTLTN